MNLTQFLEAWFFLWDHWIPRIPPGYVPVQRDCPRSHFNGYTRPVGHGTDPIDHCTVQCTCPPPKACQARDLDAFLWTQNTGCNCDYDKNWWENIPKKVFKSIEIFSAFLAILVGHYTGPVNHFIGRVGHNAGLVDHRTDLYLSNKRWIRKNGQKSLCFSSKPSCKSTQLCNFLRHSVNLTFCPWELLYCFRILWSSHHKVLAAELHSNSI
jgi:hypothetical protein